MLSRGQIFKESTFHQSELFICPRPNIGYKSSSSSCNNRPAHSHISPSAATWASAMVRLTHMVWLSALNPYQQKQASQSVFFFFFFLFLAFSYSFLLFCLVWSINFVTGARPQAQNTPLSIHHQVPIPISLSGPQLQESGWSTVPGLYPTGSYPFVNLVVGGPPTLLYYYSSSFVEGPLSLITN